jgi:hypothetical protein
MSNCKLVTTPLSTSEKLFMYNNKIVPTQGKYVVDLLRRVGMSNCKLVITPLSTSEKLSMYNGTLLGPEDATK